MNNQKIELTIVVNGTGTEVEANLNAPLQTVIHKALEQTGNQGQPEDNWQLKDIDGNLLDVTKKIGDYHFPEGVKLFLSLKAGKGG